MQVLERLPVDKAGERMRRLRNPGRENSPNLVEETLPKLRLDSYRDPFGRQLRFNLQRERHDLVIRYRRLCFGEMLRQWTTRKEVHLESANETFPIAPMNAQGRRRIHPGEQCVKPLWPLRIGDPLEARP